MLVLVLVLVLVLLLLLLQPGHVDAAGLCPLWSCWHLIRGRGGDAVLGTGHGRRRRRPRHPARF